MNSFLQAEASYLAAPEGIEPIIEDLPGNDVDPSPYICEHGDDETGCRDRAVAELSWPMEDHDLPSGFFCQKHLDEVLQ